MIIPARDIVNANEAGFELATIDHFKDLLTEAIDEIIGSADALVPPEVLQQLRETEIRFECMFRFLPNSKVILWKREERFITLAPSVDSLRNEFPFLALQQKVMK